MKSFNSFIFFLLLGVTVSCSKAQSYESQVSFEGQSDPEAMVVGHKVKLYSEILGEERELYISLPEKYNEHVQDYPVVFALEAEFLFEATRTVSRYMTSRSKMPESIVVGLANGDYDKRHDFNYERWKGIPDKTLAYFNHELIPFVEKNYRANTHRTIIGLSPTTGFLYQAYLRQPGMFKGYIALSAHLEWDRVIGTKIIDEIMSKNNDPDYQSSTFYLGRAESDFPDYDGSQEAFEEALQKLESYTPDHVNIKVDIIEGNEHYLMSLAGIQSGFEAIYQRGFDRNPGLAGWQKDPNFAYSYYKEHYEKLSSLYGFTIYPVENAHGHGFSISGNIFTAQKWGEYEQIKPLALIGTQYFPNSAYMHMALAEAYKREGNQELALEEGKKAIELVQVYNKEELENYNRRFEALKDGR